MPPKKALSNAAITRLSWPALVEQCEHWGAPLVQGQLDFEARAALARKVADSQTGQEVGNAAPKPAEAKPAQPVQMPDALTDAVQDPISSMPHCVLQQSQTRQLQEEAPGAVPCPYKMSPCKNFPPSAVAPA